MSGTLINLARGSSIFGVCQCSTSISVVLVSQSYVVLAVVFLEYIPLAQVFLEVLSSTPQVFQEYVVEVLIF